MILMNKNLYNKLLKNHLRLVLHLGVEAGGKDAKRARGHQRQDRRGDRESALAATLRVQPEGVQGETRPPPIGTQIGRAMRKR